MLSSVSFEVKAQNKSAMDGSLPTRFVKFYPNPATTNISFDLQKSYNNHYSLTVYSLMGKKIAEIRNIYPHNAINLDNFYRGIYIFQLRDKNGLIIESGKFQVVR
jgi:hypothetical protein